MLQKSFPYLAKSFQKEADGLSRKVVDRESLVAMPGTITFLESLLNWVSLADFWSNYVWFGTFVLIVALIRFLNVLSYPEKPRVTYMQKTIGKNHISIGDMLDRCPILNEVLVYYLLLDSSLSLVKCLCLMLIKRRKKALCIHDMDMG